MAITLFIIIFVFKIWQFRIRKFTDIKIYFSVIEYKCKYQRLICWQRTALGNFSQIRLRHTNQCNVNLPYKSLVANKSYELYQYNHFNKLPRKDGEKCPFCRLSRRVEIICETATCVAFYDGYPVSPGHALIIPKRHVANYFDLTNHEREAKNVVLQYVKQKVEERFHPDGYNIGINVGEYAGQSVFHCHMHLIPRYKGDVENPKGGVWGVIPSKQKYWKCLEYAQFTSHISKRCDMSHILIQTN